MKSPRTNLLTNYWHTFIRSSRRSSMYLLLAIFGLATGYAAALLIGRYVSHELSYDSYHQNSHRIFRLVNQGVVKVNCVRGEDLAAQLPEIREFVRIINHQDVADHEARTLVEYGDKKIAESKFAYVDSNVFRVFSWPLLSGDAAKILNKPFTVVLSESTAQKYFGTEDPLGKIIRIYSWGSRPYDLAVTGVFRDIPKSSHLTFDFFTNLETYKSIYDTDFRRTTVSAWTYFLVDDAAVPSELLEKMRKLLHSTLGNQVNLSTLGLQPLTSIHLDRKDADGNFHKDITLIIVLLAIAGFILVSSVLNFINLFVVYAQRRLKEVGMRKMFGATRTQVVGQFLGEALVLSSIGAVIGVVLILFMLPVFNDFTSLDFTLVDVFNGRFIALWFFVNLFVGLAAGVLPSLSLANVEVSKVTKGEKISFYKMGNLQRVMMVFQFTISVALIFSTLVMVKQIDFLRSKDLGFASEQVLIIPLNGAREIEANHIPFQNDLEKIAGVSDVAFSHSIPGQFLRVDWYRPEGMPREDSLQTSEVLVGHDFLDFYKVDILAGRTFDPARPGDSVVFVINEAALKHFGWKTPAEAVESRLARTRRYGGLQAPVIGVVSNFHYQSLHHEVQPTVFFLIRAYYNYASVRLTTGNPGSIAGTETLSQIESAWQAHERTHPFESYFLDDDLQRRYTREESLGNMIGWSALLAIVIGCGGLFGMAAYSIRNRQREVGIRKTLGASVFRIVTMFTKQYLLLASVACVIALPFSYLAMKAWLDSFPYRAPLGVDILIISALSAATLTLLSVIFQAVQTGMMNPVGAIRKE